VPKLNVSDALAHAHCLAGTIEDMLGSRMRIHLAMLENYELEIKGLLEGKLDSEVDACALKSPNPDLAIS
jgi:hypothetical protein